MVRNTRAAITISLFTLTHNLRIVYLPHLLGPLRSAPGRISSLGLRSERSHADSSTPHTICSPDTPPRHRRNPDLRYLRYLKWREDSAASLEVVRDSECFAKE